MAPPAQNRQKKNPIDGSPRDDHSTCLRGRLKESCDSSETLSRRGGTKGGLDHLRGGSAGGPRGWVETMKKKRGRRKTAESRLNGRKKERRNNELTFAAEGGEKGRIKMLKNKAKNPHTSN